MTIRFDIHPVDPQGRLLYQAAQVLRDGGIVAMPTDACYVLAAGVSHKGAVDKMRQIRQLSDKHLLSLMCSDLKQLSVYAQVDNTQYRFLREWTPGPYTFVLKATKETPRRIWHPARKTIGLRVPDSKIAQGVLRELDEPFLVTSLVMPEESDPLHDADEIIDNLGKRLDAVIDVGGHGQSLQPTTIIDVTGSTPVIEREGCGPVQGMIG
jgi:tRNA threonylcarbamoyl adenosine modification protein (Sua5/YciO/YrdC/YwlC family)